MSDRSPAVIPTERTRLKRRAQRGSYDRAQIDAILDEAFVAHVAFSHGGQAAVIPTVYARLGDWLYLHGSPANRMLCALADGGEACLCATLLDGLILARSAFHTSVNYRSVVVYARGEGVDDPAEKLEALRATVEHAIPGRWKDVRGPSPEELRQTRVVKLPIEEASAKIRVGGPVDDDEDLALPCWAGVLPAGLAFGTPQPDPGLAARVEAPEYVTRYRRPGR